MLHIKITQFQDFITPRIIGFPDYITLKTTHFLDFITHNIIGFKDYVTFRVIFV